MDQYVALFYGDDGHLGRTIGPINGWDEAVKQAAKLAEEQKEPLSKEELVHLNETGDARIPSGAIHVGGLESPDED